ncbi:putative BAR adaptor protein RVS161 [Syncephalis plumigaleata]|nr:putative BAR adaptor protein RVS161 [Syncephalis plumigaleata]
MIISMETKMNKLHKDAKGYLDSLRSLSNSQMHIANTVAQFLESSQDSELGASAARYKSVMSEIDQSLRGDVDEQCRETVLNPIGRYCALFPEVNDAVRKRHNKLLDYDAARSKVRKLTEKPSDDPSKLPRAEANMRQSQEIYDALNSQLITELPKLVDLRVPYLDPSFEALVKLQHRFSSESHDRLQSLQIPGASSDGTNLRQNDGELAQIMQEMRELSICGLS